MNLNLIISFKQTIHSDVFFVSCIVGPKTEFFIFDGIFPIKMKNIHIIKKRMKQYSYRPHLNKQFCVLIFFYILESLTEIFEFDN